MARQPILTKLPPEYTEEEWEDGDWEAEWGDEDWEAEWGDEDWEAEWGDEDREAEWGDEDREADWMPQEIGVDPLPAREMHDPDGSTLDVAINRLQNMIPGEVITLWAAIQGIIAIHGEAIPNIWWISLFTLLIILIPPYLDRTIDQSKIITDFGRYNVISQIILATGAFVVWVYYLGGPFEAMGYHDTLLATFLVILYPVLMLIAAPYYISRGIQIIHNFERR
ncbi:hypothetical protein [Natronorubrum halophilum]|uniref:hypothetical protein n=1 Tax=Natronorubrum halophilum TaxID=1702106 RepID=UPI0010C21846|nr:hypothetical protein [Natronorubrum halophilum]